MSAPKPVHLGRYSPAHAGDIEDFGIDVTADLASGETLSSVTFTVTNAAGVVQAGAVTAQTVASPVVSYRVAVPATVGVYTIAAVCTMSDGRKLTYTADLWVV
jgi:hypothetical protein